MQAKCFRQIYRITEWQNNGITELQWQTAVNIDFYESIIKTTVFSWQIYVQNYPDEVEKSCL